MALSVLAAQELELAWDFLAIDSGSDDDTLPILARHASDFPVPLRVRAIHQVEFDHGDTRNLLAASSEGELLVFLTQDAIPVGTDWLARGRNLRLEHDWECFGDRPDKPRTPPGAGSALGVSF